MTQRNTCNQFTPQLWRATKCKFCFKDKDSHAADGKENSTVGQNPPQSPAKRTYSTGTRPPEAFVKVTPRRAVSHIDTGPRSPTVLSSDSDSNKNVRPSRVSTAASSKMTSSHSVYLLQFIQITSLFISLSDCHSNSHKRSNSGKAIVHYISDREY